MACNGRGRIAHLAGEKACDLFNVVSNESVLVGNHFHLLLNSQVFSEVVAVPQNVGTTKLLMEMCS